MTTIIDGSASAEFETPLPVAEGGTGATASTGSGNVVLSASPTFTGTVTASGDFVQGSASSPVRLSSKTTANWNYSQLDIQRNASNTANFKAISFRLDGDTASDTNLYNYPNILINTDSAPTTGDTSVLENASLTINTPSTIRFGTNGAERMRIASDGAVTLGTPLPAASGGTGNTQGGQVVRNHYINSTGSAQNLGPTSTMTAVGCTANIPVTAGNILTVWWTVGVYTNAAAHWAGTAFLDSTSLGHGQWGDGIHNGSTTLTGWQTSTGQNRIVIPTTKTASLSLRMTCNAGSITIRKDGNLGYDGAWMIVQETTP